MDAKYMCLQINVNIFMYYKNKGLCSVENKIIIKNEYVLNNLGMHILYNPKIVYIL